MLHGWSGVALLVIGIALVALDPGKKVEEGGGGGGDGAAAIPEDGPPIYWIAIALVCASAYAFYNIFIKKGSASINPILGGEPSACGHLYSFLYNRCFLSVLFLTSSRLFLILIYFLPGFCSRALLL